MEVLKIFGSGTLLTFVTFIFVIITKYIDDMRTTDFDDDEAIAEYNNMGVAFRRFGLYVGLAIGFGGTLMGKSQGLQNDLISLTVDGTLIIAFMFLCRFVNDKIMLSNIDNDEEIKNGNVATGLAECGMFIATGLVLNGSFSGNGSDIIHGAISAGIFFVLGQGALLLTSLCYEFITPFNVRDEIKKGNVAAGVALAGMLISIGIIMRACVAGDSAGLLNDIRSFAVYMSLGIVLLLVFRELIDRFLLPTTDLATEVKRDKNVAALTLVQGALIAISVIISFAI